MFFNQIYTKMTKAPLCALAFQTGLYHKSERGSSKIRKNPAYFIVFLFFISRPLPQAFQRGLNFSAFQIEFLRQDLAQSFGIAGKKVFFKHQIIGILADFNGTLDVIDAKLLCIVDRIAEDRSSNKIPV